MSTPKVKHLKTKTVIELTPKQVDQYAKYLRELDSATSTLHECQDMFMSDLGRLETLRWRLTDLLGLEWNSEKHRYRGQGK